MDTRDIIELCGLLLAVAGGIALWAVRVSNGETASKKVAQIERDLAEFKEKVAREYATAAMVVGVERAVTDAFNRLSDRIDRLLERGSVAPRPTTRSKP